MKIRKRKGATCYFCGNTATGSEHVPPKSFFPEDKDLPPGYPSVRRQLITVPSCSAHNNRYSDDDEVAAYLVLMGLETNALGVNQFRTKAMRALQKSFNLQRRMFPSNSPVPVRLADGSPTVALKVDPKLLERELEKVARGLYWHDFNTIWKAPLGIYNDVLRMPSLALPPWAREMAWLKGAFEASASTTAPKSGANQAVFFYQWMKDGKHVEPALRMCFYEGINFYALALPEEARASSGG